MEFQKGEFLRKKFPSERSSKHWPNSMNSYKRGSLLAMISRKSDSKARSSREGIPTREIKNDVSNATSFWKERPQCERLPEGGVAQSNKLLGREATMRDAPRRRSCPKQQASWKRVHNARCFQKEKSPSRVKQCITRNAHSA
jgi:hypothetical protein